ncbi:MAG: SpoIIE family protein phosphatase [Hyphomicrobiaceae bacterium]
MMALPLDVRVAPHALPMDSAGTAGKGTVLVVEDATSVLSLLTMMLRRQGYRTLAAADAEEALELLAEHEPDVVITDFDLPGMNGISLCSVIHEVVGLPVHVIILSAHCDHIVTGLDAGAADYVCKPFVAAELMARVASGMRAVARQKRLACASRSLQRSFDCLAADRDRIGRDLGDAARLQAGLLPPAVVRCNGVTISCQLQPECVLSGDMVGALARRTGEVAMYAVDASGSGTPAALLATSIALELRGERAGGLGSGCPISSETASAHEVVARLNRRFVDFARSDRYSTLAYALMDVRRHRAEICVAGHPRPALLGTDGTVAFVGDGGPPVGLLDDVSYQSVEVDFRPGDRLVLFSDGFIEARLTGGTQVGYQGMAELLRSLAAQPRDALAPALVEALGRRLGRAADDDVSVIAAECEGDTEGCSFSGTA